MRVKVQPSADGIAIRPGKKNSRIYYMGTVLLSGVFLSPTGPTGELIDEFSEQWPLPARKFMIEVRVQDGKFLTREKEPVDLTGKTLRAAYIVGNRIYVSKD